MPRMWFPGRPIRGSSPLQRNNYQRRHNAVRDALVTVLHEAGQSYAMEVQLPSQPEGSLLRPADILLKGWASGKDTAVDITICHGWQQNNSEQHHVEGEMAHLPQKERIY